MTRYIYVGEGMYFPGLPANDLDDEQLNDAQKILLKMAVETNLYKAETETKAKVENAKPATKDRKTTATGGEEDGKPS